MSELTINDPANASPITSRFSEPVELVMYARSISCPFVTLAHRILSEAAVPYREILIDQDKAAEQRVVTWTGFLSVPTLIAARPGEDLPLTLPTPLPTGASPRGIDRGALITEPDNDQLRGWLRAVGLLPR